MTNTIKLKRGSGSDPSASDMVVGEPVLRSDTAELFFKKDDGSVAKVSGGGGGGSSFKYLALRNAANDGAASYPGNDFTLVTSGTTTAVSPATANALILSYGGVVQKPNSGTSTSGITGFIVDGSRLKTATNFAAAPDFIVYQESGGIGEPSDNTVTEAKLNASNSPTNGYFLQAQSGNTGGLTWAAAPANDSSTGIDFDDNVKARWGTGNDLEIFHNGTHSEIADAGTGDLRLLTSKFKVINNPASADENMIVATENGAVELYYDGVKKLETASYGLSTDGLLNFNGTGGKILIGDSGEIQLGGGPDLKIYHNGTDGYINLDANALFFQYGGVNKFYFGSLGTTHKDNYKGFFGDSQDLQIYHDGSTNYLYSDNGHIVARVPTTKGFRVQKNNGQEDVLNAYADGAVELYYDNSKKLNTESWGVQVTGTLQCSSHINLGDGDELKIGDGEDLLLYHNGTDSFVNNATGTLRILSDNIYIKDKDNGDMFIDMLHDGAVGLYHNGDLRLKTWSDGVNIYGDEGEDAILHLYADDGDDNADKWRVRASTIGSLYIQNYADGAWESNIIAAGNGGVFLYYDNSKKLETASHGITAFGDVFFDNQVNAGKDIYWDESADRLSFNDNVHATFGNGEDLRIYHAGTHSYIHNNTGQINIRSTGGIYLRNTGGSEKFAAFINNGSVELYYDNSKKAFTTSTGFRIDGDCYPNGDGIYDLGKSNERWDDVYATNGTIQTSDRNEKNTIVESDLGLNFVNKLKPVSYKWNRENSKTHYGLIAQDIEEILSTEGKTDKDFAALNIPTEGPIGLNYSELISPLIKAVQELSAEVETLKTKVAALEGA